VNNTKKKKKLLTTKNIFLALLALAAIVFVIYVVIAQSLAMRVSKELTVNDTKAIIEEKIAELPKEQALSALYLAENIEVDVKSVEKGEKKSFIVDCEIKTLDLYDIVSQNIDRYFGLAYEYEQKRAEEGQIMKPNSTLIRQNIVDDFNKDIEKAEKSNKRVVIKIFEISENNYQLYYTDEVINAIFGDYRKAVELINNAETCTIEGEEVSVKNNSTYKNGIIECFTLNNYEKNVEPDPSIPAVKWLNSVKDSFVRNFLEEDQGRPRYMYIVDGIKNTILVTLASLIIGIVIGFVVAVIRVTNDTTGALDFGAWICKLYLSVMRGTPLMIQLLIIYFVILLPAGVGSVPSAIICFGLNSGAYVSEIVRGGIMSVDKGQMEAGRSLGFNYIRTMYHIVLPQAFKAVLPSLANEFITLLKETSVAFYIGVADLTLGGLKIRSITYSSFMPLVAIAIIYLILVLGLSKLVSILERRLRKGDNR